MPICRECGKNYSYSKADLKNGIIPDPTVCINCVRKGNDFKDASYVSRKKKKKDKDELEFKESENNDFGGFEG